MTDEQTNVLGHICDIRDALDGLVVWPDQFTPEATMELCRLSNRLNALLIKLTEKRHD